MPPAEWFRARQERVSRKGSGRARTGRFDAEAMKQAVVVGSALASFVVEAFGPEPLLHLTPEAVAERVAAFYRLSAIPDGLVAAGTERPAPPTPAGSS